MLVILLLKLNTIVVTLLVGDGNCLAISHVGRNFVQSDSHHAPPIMLNNLLHVPHINRNFQSFAQLTSDNNLYAKYLSRYCLVKDKTTTKRARLHETLKNGLYLLDLPLQTTLSLIRVSLQFKITFPS